MTAKRHLVAADLTAPRGICRWCKQPVKPPKRNWCGDACVEEYLVRASPAHARRRVLERDRGICAICGLDCAALEEAIRKRPQWARPAEGFTLDDVLRVKREIAELLTLLGMRGSTTWFEPKDTYWEMDHIVPVVEGGGACGLDNLRTLCIACHQQETAALAARRAAARRAEVASPEPAPPAQQPLFAGGGM